jgi:hydrogenase-4 transcriptional activator
MDQNYPPGKPLAQGLTAAGQAALQEGHYQEASDHFSAALRAGPHSPEEEALIRSDLSTAFRRQGMHGESLEIVAKYQGSAELVRLSEPAQVRVLICLGSGKLFNREIPQAIASFNQAMQISRRFQDNEAIGQCYLGLSRAYRFISENQVAREHNEAALECLRHGGNWWLLAYAYFSIGEIDFADGEFRQALAAHQQALAIVGSHKDYHFLGLLYGDLGTISLTFGSGETGIGYYKRAIDYSKKAGSDIPLALAYNNYGIILLWLGDWPRAEQLLQSAIEVLSATGRRSDFLSGALDSLAQLYLLRGRLDEASRLLDQAEKVLSELKKRLPHLDRGLRDEVTLLTTKGWYFTIKGELDEALKYLERGVAVGLSSDYKFHLVLALIRLGEVWLARGEIARARRQADLARQKMQEAPVLTFWGPMMRLIARIEAAEGHTTAAIQSLAQSTSVFEYRGYIYERAVNHLVYAQLLEKQQLYAGAMIEVRQALEVFERLGATIDEAQASAYLTNLHRCQAGITDDAAACVSLLALTSEAANDGLMGKKTNTTSMFWSSGALSHASEIGGLIAKRLVQASISRELLLYELAAIVRQQTGSRAALIAEVEGGGLKPLVAIGLNDREKAAEMEFLKRISVDEHASHGVYEFGDGNDANFLLHVIAPEAERHGALNIKPWLHLASLGLETWFHRSQRRKVNIFDPAKLLAEAKLPGFICASGAMRRVLEQVGKISSANVTVLITGESGTGKELIAQAVHTRSTKRSGAFVAFNCAAAPREMIESQLFGYRKGAFTGAMEHYAGVVRAAQGGTLFLDEVGDLPLELQPKLLRFLQEGEIQPLGESKPLRVDVRVIAATNAAIEQAVAEGRFREDLFHRLNIIRIHLPPLRERREEIPTLLDYYLKRYQLEAGKTGIKISEEAMDLMIVYDWPGNVRQLCNEVRRVVTYSESNTVMSKEALSLELRQRLPEAEAVETTAADKVHINVSNARRLAEAISEVERQMIEVALYRNAGNIARAAKELGLTRRGLYMKMSRLKVRI